MHIQAGIIHKEYPMSGFQIFSDLCDLGKSQPSTPIPGRLGSVHSAQGWAGDDLFFLVLCLALMYARKEPVQSWI